MNDTLGVAVLALAAIATLATVFVGRQHYANGVVDALLAVEGAALGIGGLLLVDDVGVASWVLTPLALAVLAPVHVRALFAGEGPFRT